MMGMKKQINDWRKRIEKIQKQGRKSASDLGDKSNGLYQWLELDDIIRDMNDAVVH